MLLTFPKTEQDLYLIEESTGVLWFKAADICLILGFSNPAVAISNHCPDDSKTIDYQSGRGRAGLFVSEPGMYLLIMESKSKVSGDFRQWLAREVLPQIRKTGSFNGVPNTDSAGSEFLALVDAAIARNLEPERLIDLHRRYKKSEDTPPIAKSRKAIPQSVNQKAETSDLEMVEALQRLVSRRPDLLVEGGVTARVIRQNTRRLGKGRDAILASLKCLERSGHGVIRCLPKGSVVFVLR